MGMLLESNNRAGTGQFGSHPNPRPWLGLQRRGLCPDRTGTQVAWFTCNAIERRPGVAAEAKRHIE